jgi:hypothetical protein
MKLWQMIDRGNGMTSVTFVAPPGWPTAQPGMLPPMNWQPAANLPPVPAGWVFYRGSAGEPVAPPPGAWVPPVAQTAGFPGAGVSAPQYHPGGSVPPAPVSAPAAQSPLGGSIAPGVPIAPSAPGMSGYPGLAQPSGAFPQFQGEPPVAKKSRKVLWLIITGIVVVALAVTGVILVPKLMAGSTVSAASFDKLTTVSQFNGGSTKWHPTGSGWDLTSTASIASCKEVDEYDTYQAKSAYRSEAGTEVWVLRFESVSALQKSRDLWTQCNNDAKTSDLDWLKDSGSADGVSWDAGTSLTSFWYGNVVVWVASSRTVASNPAPTAKEVKTIFDSLR